MTRQTSRDIQRLETLGTPYESHQSADEVAEDLMEFFGFGL